MSQPLKILIYTDYPSCSLKIPDISEYLLRFGFEVQYVGEFLSALGLSDDSIAKAAREFAGSIVDDIEIDKQRLSVPPGESIASEINRLLGKEPTRGVLYDGFWFQRIVHRLMMNTISQPEQNCIKLIFTARLFGTFENRRYHSRVLLAGSPSLISTSGLVEAPAKPREYYYIKGRLIQSGKDLSVLDEMYTGRYVEYDDPKITSIMCSYALQAVFYYITGDPFCDSPECCLYNSHWQEDVIKTQYGGKPCDSCMKLLIQ